MTISQEEYDQGLRDTIEEINQLYLAGAINAIGVIIIKEDNDARTFLHHEEGASFPLLAGCTLLQHQMVELLRRRSR